MSQKSFIFMGVWVVVVVSMVVYAALPSTHQKIGDIFFGGVPKLYNVILAEFFFELATNPIVGKIPPYAHYQLSRTYFIKGNLEESLQEAYKELELYPENLRTNYIVGLTLGYMDREEEAIEAFGKFIEWRPESWAARNDRAWLQFRIGDIEGALKTIEPAVQNISNPWIQNTHGTLLMNGGRYEEARKAFEYAKISADYMDEEDWGKAYPGNDPRIYATGLKGMRLSVENNLEILRGIGY